MTRYLKLVHYELARVRTWLLSLSALTLAFQFGGLWYYAQSYVSRAHKTMLRESLSAAEYTARNGAASFYRFTTDFWFLAPIAIGASVLLVYVFLIWYRDWFGKNMFIYRLMMLPVNRMYVYLAKLNVIVLAVLGLVSVQLLILPVQNGLFNMLVSEDLRFDVSVPDVVSTNQLLQMIVPDTLTDFILYYVTGIAAVVVVFTAILIERSYRLKGAFGGVLYGGLCLLVFTLPLFISETFFPEFLYPREMFVMELVAGFLIACGSFWLSTYLMKNKISV